MHICFNTFLINAFGKGQFQCRGNQGSSFNIFGALLKVDSSVQEEYVAPLVAYLSSDSNEETTGGLFQVAGGWIAQIRWQRAGGHGFPVNHPLTPETIVSKWKLVTDFGKTCFILSPSGAYTVCRRRSRHKPCKHPRGIHAG